MLLEYILTCGNGLLFAHALKTPVVPGFLRTFDNHRRGVGVKLIGVDPHPAMFGFFKDKGERVVKLLPRAKPDEFAQAHIYIGFEVVLKLVADQ